MDRSLARFSQFYNQFSEAWIERLEELYAPGFHFQDPFHQVDGDFDTLRTYFRRVLTSLAVTKFTVDDVATGNDGSYVRWHWDWKRKQSDPLHSVAGVTHLRFDSDGKITFHQDLFDAAEGFFETLPILGSALRFVKKRV